MERYIKATECAKIISEKLGIELFDLVDVFAEIPTAEVVPKSEVERLLDDFQRTIRADAKVSMSAGEILLHINNMLAELKKKYTEGENER